MCYTISTMQPVVQHTLSIYRAIANRIPPLVPAAILEDLKTEIDRFSRADDPSLNDLEQSMAIHGMKLWPYTKAFEEIVSSHEKLMVDKIFVQKASLPLRKKYLLVRELGGDFQSVYRGTIHGHFDHDERRELNELLIDLKHDIRRYAMQAVLTHDRKTYEEKIEYYGRMIEEVNAVIVSLREFAKNHHGEHHDLAHEVENNIRAIEHGISLLGPEIDIEVIRKMPEHYQGRKEEKKMH